MPDAQVFPVATALMRVLEQVLLTVIAPDPMTALRLALLATKLRVRPSR
jgi:hypothetical protein